MSVISYQLSAFSYQFSPYIEIMKKIFALIILLPWLFVSTQGQANKRVSFLATTCAPGQDVCVTKQIYRFDLENGEVVSKELVVSTEETIYFHGSTDRIYQNRFLVTDGGEIFDLVEKKMILNEAGDLHRIEGNKIFYRVNRSDRQGLFVYDLENRQYAKVGEADDRMLFAELSPDGTKSLEWSCPVDEGCRIEMREFGKGVTRVFKGDFRVQRDSRACERVEVPVFWVDNERFLTQKDNGEILLGNVNGRIKKLLKFKINELPGGNPKFFRDKNGRIVYQCVLDFLIDVDKKAVSIYNPLGEGFSEYKNEYFLHGKSIGAFDGGYAINTKDYLVAEYWEKALNGDNTPGVRIWSTFKKTWTTVDLSWSTHLIGFIE